LVGLQSCDDVPQPNDDVVIPPSNKGAVWISNEGNFQFGNASLTVLDLEQDKLLSDAFEAANARKLGDVLQSVNMINGKAYLVVNNSRKIEVVDPLTYRSIATINGFISPRYIVKVDANRAYVSEYYANNIKIVDLNNNQIIDSIKASGWMDEMILLENKLYVTSVSNASVYVINVVNNNIADTIPVTSGPNSLQLDAANHLWVLSKGNRSIGIRPALHKIDTKSDSVVQVFFTRIAPNEATRLRTNAEKTVLYWLNEHIYRHSISSLVLESEPFILSNGNNFYALGVNPFTGEIYAGDAKDFVSKSTVFRYRSNGQPIGEFKAGIIAGDFYFFKP
jgi:YVTN family beta-propeller protein